MKTFIKVMLIPFIIVSGINWVSIIEPFIVLNKYGDVIKNKVKYKKVILKVDSLYYSFSDDMDNGSYYGYSKNLDNYNTTIFFGKHVTGYEDRSWYEKSKVKNDSIRIGEHNDIKFHYVWYRKGYNKAFPATEDEIVFPLRSRLLDELRLFIIWFISTLCAIIIYKIGIKIGVTKNEQQV